MFLDISGVSARMWPTVRTLGAGPCRAARRVVIGRADRRHAPSTAARVGVSAHAGAAMASGSAAACRELCSSSGPAARASFAAPGQAPKRSLTKSSQGRQARRSLGPRKTATYRFAAHRKVGPEETDVCAACAPPSLPVRLAAPCARATAVPLGEEGGSSAEPGAVPHCPSFAAEPGAVPRCPSFAATAPWAPFAWGPS